LMKLKWTLARFVLAATPLLSILLWKPTIGGYVRAALWFTATFIPFYILRWPKILDGDGEGIAGAWGLKATCKCYSSPPPPMFPGRGVVSISNEGYETKICTYTTYALRPPQVEGELPRGGRSCGPGFKAGGKPLPPPLAASRVTHTDITADVVAVAWDAEGKAASIYLRGHDTVRIPRLLRPPTADNPYIEYEARLKYFSAARELAYTLLSRAKPRPSQGIRIGLDEQGREYRIPLTHMGVFGSTGCGKTSLLALLAERLAEKGYRTWIVDPYGEYTGLKSFQVLYTTPDPFELKSPEEITDLLETTSMIVFGPERGAYSPIVRQILLQTLRNSGNLKQAIAELERSIATSNRQDIISAAAAALRRLEPLRRIKWMKPGREIPDRAVFDISLLNPMARTLAANAIIEKAWETGNTVVLIDEAGSLARAVGQGYVAIPALEKVLTLGRSRRTYIVLADQYADRLPYALLGQMTKIWMRTNPPVPRSAPEDIRDILPRLARGEALINGTLVKIDPPPKLKSKVAAVVDKVSLEELEAFLQGTAAEEVKIKLWILGLAKGSELTRLGKRVYSALKSRVE